MRGRNETAIENPVAALEGGATSGKEEESHAHREYVLEILDTRRTIPKRSPEDWMKFLASLDAWYRSDQTNCVATLRDRNNEWVLDLVITSMDATSEENLLAIAKQTTSSAAQLEYFTEIWRRKAESEPSQCAEFLLSIPTLMRPLFQEKLVKLWVEKKGVNALSEIAASRVTTQADYENAFKLCAKSLPEEALKYLKTADRDSLTARFGRKLDMYPMLYQVGMRLPPLRAIEVLSMEPPNIIRDGRIGAAVYEAVIQNPKVAAELILKNPLFISEVAVSSKRVAEKDPIAGAQVVNLIPGERRRSFAAVRAVMVLPTEKAQKFVDSLSDSLTKAVASAALKRKTPTAPSTNK